MTLQELAQKLQQTQDTWGYVAQQIAAQQSSMGRAPQGTPVKVEDEDKFVTYAKRILDRDDNVVLAVLAGVRRATVAEQWGLTIGRVSQIFSAWSRKVEPWLWNKTKTRS